MGTQISDMLQHLTAMICHQGRVSLLAPSLCRKSTENIMILTTSMQVLDCVHVLRLCYRHHPNQTQQQLQVALPAEKQA